MKGYNKLIFEISKDERKAYSLPECDVLDVAIDELIDPSLLRESDLGLPQVSEPQLMRHYTLLSNNNFGVDTGFYPLGSCTMKYNPKINEDMASSSNFVNIHPYQKEETVQGSLELMYNLSSMFAEITGMDEVSLQPAAGAHGELSSLMIIKAYLETKGEKHRNRIIVPDSAHGTNPASASVAGFQVVEIKSNKDGSINIEALKEALDENTAGLMLTNPSTLGIFEENIKEIATLVHAAGALLYYDGANMNAIMGIARPGDMGFDVVHLNAHKTFSTPHGGGGPGSGPIGVKKELIPYLPVPIIEKNEDKYSLNYDKPLSIGKVKSFYGNFGVLVRAYTYILSMGAEGLRAASETAVLNANYMMNSLKEHYTLPIDKTCMHEFVLSGSGLLETGTTTIDVAKRLLDYGYHPPTIYFPLIVDSAMMIEPTESETLETLDEFIKTMIKIAKEAKENPDLLKNAPHNTPVRRLDEVTAARKPVVKWVKS
ncbi:aminomethyl-transferring glycine dehydrogenase subunit GcvPB [Clostridium sp. DL1XJH146]